MTAAISAPELTDALVADSGTEPGVLPLLSTALLELWQARDAGRLTLAAYRASGGLQGAIARLAEATYAGLDPHRRAVARALLLRLAGPGEGAELVRRRVTLEELDTGSDPVLGEVLATLTVARLLTAGEGHVEVAHEALLREWPRLQGWLEEDASGRQVRLHLIGAVGDWQARGRESGDLYRGARLAAALEWAAEHPVELNAAERSFLDASRQASEREVERQRRMNRRLRALLAGAAALLVVAVAAGGLAAVQGQRAADEARNATDQKLLAQQAADQAKEQSSLAQQAAREARSRELIASALAARDLDGSLAKLLAVEATKGAGAPTFQSTNVLRQVLAADPVIARYSWPKDQPVDWLWTDLDPAGRRLVASGVIWYPSRHLEVADPRTGTVLWSYPTGGASATSGDGFIGPSFFSADGARVIAGLYWTNPEVAPPSGISLGVAIWNAGTGELEKLIDVGPCGGAVAAVSPGRLLVRTPTPGKDGRTGCHWPMSAQDGFAPVLVVDPATGAVTKVAEQAILSWGGVFDGTMSGNGRFVGYDLYERGACGPRCQTSVVVDLDVHMKRVFQLDASSSASRVAYARLLNNDGTLLLYGDSPMVVYEIPGSTTAAVRPQLGALGGYSGGAEFDPSGQTVYETSWNRVLRRWNPRTGEVLATWPEIANGRPSVAADGRTVLVGGTGSSRSAGAVLLGTAIRGDLGGVSAPCPGFTYGGTLHVGAGLAAFNVACDGPGGSDTIQVIDLAKKQLLTSWKGWGSQGLTISPDGRSFVSQASKPPAVQGPPTVVDVRTGRPIVVLEGVCTIDWTSSSLPEEQPGCHAYPQAPFPFAVDEIVWSPDGTMIAAADGLYGYVAVWNARDGRLLFSAPARASRAQIDAYEGQPRVIFTPDSSHLLISYAFDRAAPATATVKTGVIETLSTATWATISTTSLAPSVFGSRSLSFVDFTPDGSTLLAVTGAGGTSNATLVWLDAATLQVRGPGPIEPSQLIKVAALSPDGLLLATGGSNGVLKVWNVKTGELDQQMDFGGSQVQGLAFIDDRHLAVTPQGGGLLIMTVDHAELADIVRASLTRTFTALECTTYGIEPCPTLEQMRAP
jgi:WD40 repeat protein